MPLNNVTVCTRHDGRIVRAQVLSDFGDEARRTFMPSEARKHWDDNNVMTIWTWLATIVLVCMYGDRALALRRGAAMALGYELLFLFPLLST